MPRRVKQTRFPLADLAENFINRLGGRNTRTMNKLTRYGYWLVAVWFLYSFIFGDYSIYRIVKLELQKSNLIEANRMQTVELIDAVRIKEMLKSDARYIEEIARTKYHMVRPGEIIFRYRNN